jgi:CubicO group peptidase (beta-lactamase class C family)
MLPLAWFLACSDKGDDSSAPESDADTDADADTDTDTDTDTDADPITEEDADAITAQAVRDLSGYATGAQIAVWYDGRVAYHWEVGTNGAGGKPVTQDLLFQIGSDTKKLTAMAVLQQEAAGTLSRHDTLASVIGDYQVAQDPSWSSTVTLHDLISHQGDVYDYTPWDDALDDADLAARAELFAERGWVDAPPGTYWNYSNTNFSLAGLAVEVAAGRPFADVLQEDVVDALGLTHTFVRREDAAAYGDTAVGYGIEDFENDPFDPWSDASFSVGPVSVDEQPENAYTRPAGLVWSTATDMATLGGFFLEGDPAVLSDSDREAMVTAQVRTYPSFAASAYGYGTFVNHGFNLPDGLHDETLVSHGGNTLSMTSAWYVLPAHGVAISILSNGFGDGFDLTAIEIMQRLDVFSPGTAVPDGYYPSTETDHALLAGTYWDVNLGEIEVWDDKGDLEIAIPALEELGYAVDGDLDFTFQDFYVTTIDGVAYDFTFIADGKGGYGWIRNRAIVGTRTDDQALTAFTPGPGALARIEREMTLHEGRYRPLPFALH